MQNKVRFGKGIITGTRMRNKEHMIPWIKGWLTTRKACEREQTNLCQRKNKAKVSNDTPDQINLLVSFGGLKSQIQRSTHAR